MPLPILYHLNQKVCTLRKKGCRNSTPRGAIWVSDKHDYLGKKHPSETKGAICHSNTPTFNVLGINFRDQIFSALYHPQDARDERIRLVLACYTLPKFWRYNKVNLTSAFCQTLAHFTRRIKQIKEHGGPNKFFHLRRLGGDRVQKKVHT